MSDDSVPELADAIQQLINSSPRSPSKDELMQVIRDHVSQELQKATGIDPPDLFYPNINGTASTSFVSTGIVTVTNFAPAHQHQWRYVDSYLAAHTDCRVVTERCDCGELRSRELPMIPYR